MATESVSNGYAVIRAELGNRLLPIGIAAWSGEREWFSIRLLSEDESVRGVRPQTRTLAEIAVKQIERWAQRRSVPYADGERLPWLAPFWSDVKHIMTTSIQLDEALAVDPSTEPTEALETLFEALVQPVQAPVKRQVRVDGAVTAALGAYAGYLETRTDVRAYGGAEEQVLRRAASSEGELIVEAVNLASSSATHDADALVSKLERIMHVRSSVPAFVIGYIASPGGLNGETHMRDWIRLRITEHVYDLQRQQQAFRDQAAAVLRSLRVLHADAELSLPSSRTKPRVDT